MIPIVLVGIPIEWNTLSILYQLQLTSQELVVGANARSNVGQSIVVCRSLPYVRIRDDMDSACGVRNRFMLKDAME